MTMTASMKTEMLFVTPSPFENSGSDESYLEDKPQQASSHNVHTTQ